jgi:hypothetical protein
VANTRAVDSFFRENEVINQSELVCAILTTLTDDQGVTSLTTRQINEVIRAANDIIAACERKPVYSSPGMGLTAWLASDDVGLSSRYMASVLSERFRAEYAHPRDADDFGRCQRLLIAVPSLTFQPWRCKMAAVSSQWANLINCWTEIKTLCDTNVAAADKLIQECVR